MSLGHQSCGHVATVYGLVMKTAGKREQQVLQLDECERARLAVRLLDSLPAVVVDDDEGVAEAVRRDAELEQDATRGMTLEELRRWVKPS